MEKDNVRYTDIAKYIDLAVSLSFVPTDEDIVAGEVFMTPSVQALFSVCPAPGPGC
jgi:hypothetical protein